MGKAEDLHIGDAGPAATSPLPIHFRNGQLVIPNPDFVPIISEGQSKAANSSGYPVVSDAISEEELSRLSVVPVGNKNLHSGFATTVSEVPNYVPETVIVHSTLPPKLADDPLYRQAINARNTLKSFHSGILYYDPRGAHPDTVGNINALDSTQQKLSGIMDVYEKRLLQGKDLEKAQKALQEVVQEVAGVTKNSIEHLNEIDHKSRNGIRPIINGFGSKKIRKLVSNSIMELEDLHREVSLAFPEGDASSKALRQGLRAHSVKLQALQVAYDDAVRVSGDIKGAKKALDNAIKHTKFVLEHSHEDFAVLQQGRAATTAAINNMIPEGGHKITAGAGENIVIKERSAMGARLDAIKDTLRDGKDWVAESRGWKATKTAGKWAGIAAIGAVVVGALVNKRSSREKESRDALRDQETAAMRADIAALQQSPMVGANTLMGMQPVEGERAAQIRAQRGGGMNVAVNTGNPEVGLSYDVVR